MSRALDLCDRVLQLVADAEASAQAEVNAADGHSALTRFANSFIHQNVGEDSLGVFLRVVLDGRAGSAATSAVDDDSLARLVQATLAAVRLRPEDPDWPGLAPSAPIPPVDHYDEATEHAEPAARATRVKAFVDAGPGLLAAGYCDSEGGRHAFANTEDQRVEGRSSRATLDAIHQVGKSFDAAGKAHQTALRLSEIDGAAAGIVAARKARESAEAVDLEPGHYEVVLEPECVGEMLSFLAFYGFNAKQFLEGQSFVQLGQRQFDDSLTIVDDVTDDRALGTPFDIEGTPKARLELVSGGTSSALIHDRRTARRTGNGAESTGHAIPGGETYGAFAENVFLEAGPMAPGDMVASVERGLLVTEFN